MNFEKMIEEKFPNFHLDPDCRILMDKARLREVWDVSQQCAERDPQPDDVRVDTGPSGPVSPFQMKFVHKRWGYEVWIANNELYCGKLLFVRAGRWLSYHYHKLKDEVLYVHSGKLYFTTGDENKWETTELKKGHAFHVNPWLVHQMEAEEDTTIVEFSTQHFDEDSYRVTTDNLRTGAKDELA